jgi:hypothetical protein
MSSIAARTAAPERLAAYCAPTGPLERKEAAAAVRAAMDDIDVDVQDAA